MFSGDDDDSGRRNSTGCGAQILTFWITTVGRKGERESLPQKNYYTASSSSSSSSSNECLYVLSLCVFCMDVCVRRCRQQVVTVVYLVAALN